MAKPKAERCPACGLIMIPAQHRCPNRPPADAPPLRPRTPEDGLPVQTPGRAPFTR